MRSKDPLLKSLGDYLRSVREERGWSQEELAFKAGVHRTYIGGIERAEYNVTILTLRTITDALGITILDAVKGMSKAGRRK